MPIQTEQLLCNFVGKFKVGDNLVHNANILCKLVETNQDGIMNKPIVLQVGTILEAALSEIIFRAQNYNREGVPNISENDRTAIEGKKIDKFNTVIDVMRRYGVLNGLGADIYNDLHKLRKYRNKVHIQDDVAIQGVSRDEDVAFSDDLRIWALDLNLQVLRHLNQNFNRPADLDCHANSLTIPCQPFN